jgi:hypothetical protein
VTVRLITQKKMAGIARYVGNGLGDTVMAAEAAKTTAQLLGEDLVPAHRAALAAFLHEVARRVEYGPYGPWRE